MSQFKWNTSLSVGIELIDEQHKMLIQRLNDVSDAIKKSQGAGQIVKTLDFLIDYTHFHFSTEEKHMKANDYPGIKEHLQKHEDLKKTLGDLDRDFREEGATYELADALNVFLNNWLVGHIKGIDVKFGNFLREEGIEIR